MSFLSRSTSTDDGLMRSRQTDQNEASTPPARGGPNQQVKGLFHSQASRPRVVKARTIGITRVAKRHAEILDVDTRMIFQAFIDGINAFIENCADDLPLEFRLAGLEAERWDITDSLSVLYRMSWDTSANLNHEIVLQMLVDQIGWERAEQLLPVPRLRECPLLICPQIRAARARMYHCDRVAIAARVPVA